MPSVRTLFHALREFGPRAAVLRALHEAERRTGVMSRRLARVRGWERWTLDECCPGATPRAMMDAAREGRRPFFVGGDRGGPFDRALREMLGPDGVRAAGEEADAVLDGVIPFFGALRVDTGFPPDWWRDAVSGNRLDPARDWTRMGFYGRDFGDLKFVLEPSRFLFVYPLVRAYRLSGDDRYAEGFWRALESWRLASPPMRGPLWVCGQETALRMLSWMFGMHAFLDAPSTTPERIGMLAGMVAAHGWRVEQTLEYARSQRNNHLLSEAAGLWTAGALFPEMRHAERWRSVGAAMMLEGVADQFREDGAYAQHSFNYQRLALSLCAWMIRLGALHGQAWPPEFRDRVAASLRLMAAFVEPGSGRMPNYGSNDGAHVLPLSGCGYHDFRPELQLVARVLDLPPPFPPGPWDEVSLWLLGPDALAAGPARPAAVAPEREPPPAATGYLRLGSGTSWGLVRCARYDRRPARADQLHLDLWWRGVNVVRGPGSYLYAGEPPWDNGLAGTAVHNTVAVDRKDQMQRAGRFLWLTRAQGTTHALRAGEADGWDRFEGGHDGYREAGVSHRRAVLRLGDDGWLVVDDLLGEGVHHGSLHWLLPDVPFSADPEAPGTTVFETPAGPMRWTIVSSAPARVYRVRAGVPDVPPLAPVAAALAQLRGWESPTYGELRPAVSLVCDARAPLPLRFVSLVAYGDARCVSLQAVSESVFQAADGTRTRIILPPPGTADPGRLLDGGVYPQRGFV